MITIVTIETIISEQSDFVRTQSAIQACDTKKTNKKNEFRALRPPPGIRPWRGRPDLRDRRKSTCVINRKWPEGLLRCLRGSAIAICIQKSCRCGDQPHPTASLDTKKRTLLRISPTAPERPIAEVEGFYLCPLDP